MVIDAFFFHAEKYVPDSQIMNRRLSICVTKIPHREPTPPYSF